MTTFTKIFFCCLCFFQVYTSSIYSQAEIVIINTEIISGPTDEDVTINLVAKKFSNLLGFQFTVVWDPAILAFQSTGDFGLEGLNEDFFNSNNSLTTGVLKVAWNTPVGISLAEDEIIFSINFKRLSFVPHNISFLGGSFPENSLSIEFYNLDFRIVPFQSENTQILTPSQLNGLVFFDENKDCIHQNAEKGITNLLLKFSDQNRFYFVRTDSKGRYQLQVFPGKYTLESTSPLSEYSENCSVQDTITIGFEVDNTINSRDISISALIDCPALSVSISNPRLRRCFEEFYLISYANTGTQMAEDAYVIVKFDPFLEIMGGQEGIPLGNNEFRYELGDIDRSERNSFKVFVKTNCENTSLGQTHCVEASIFPNVDCNLVSALWSMANLELTEVCADSSVQFILQNTGTGNMATSVAYQVFENLTRIDSGSIQLSQGQTRTFDYPSNGSTYRFQTSQVSNHPTPTSLFSVIEGCGINEAGDFDRGFILPFSLHESNPFYDIHCTENRGSFDPNDKRGLPMGYGPDKYIEQDQSLNYRIRFQNTGTDTAFNVVVIDTLSEHLDLSSISEITSSHEYELSFGQDNSLIFTFNDILLVDSFTNEPASNGHITFNIDQQKEVPLETVISNQAAIYFDFNKPIFTNITEHRVGKDFYQSFITTNIVELPPTIVSLQPNPFTTSTSIKIHQDQIIKGQLYLYNQIGQQIRQYDFQQNEVSISNKNLLSGVYFYEIQVDGQERISGKLMLLGK